MNVKRLLICLMVLSPIAAFTQHRAFISATVGQYYMQDMKDFQKQLEADFEAEDIQLKRVVDFPMSLMIDAGYLKAFDEGKAYAGVYANYAYTKGRLQYRDYSGETYFDQNVHRIVIGGEAIRLLGLGFEVFGKAGLNYSMLKIVSFTKVYGAGSSRDKLNFYSLGFSGTGGLAWRYTIDKLGFGIQAGYEVNIQGKTIFEENTDAHLQDSHGRDIRINWSGARIGLDVSYTF